MTLTSELTRLIREKPIDQADLDQAALMALDAAANMIAGVNSDPGRRLSAWGRDTGVLKENGSLEGDIGRRAFLLGALCHILEVDDLHRVSVVHPGCVVVPVVWAWGAASAEPLEGRHALTALLRGFEATSRLGMTVGPAHYRVWHNTATCGPFGSAFATASLLDLDDAACVNALGNAGTQAAGLWEFLDTGAMSKHVHAGRGAEAGYIAATLAAHGITGAPTILEGRRGFFAAMCADGSSESLLLDPHAPWQVHQTSIKPWPSCRHTHPSIDAAQELRSTLHDKKFALDDIAAVDIGAYQAGIALCDNATPTSAYAAKFSLQHCVAAALARDQVWFEAFEEDERRALAALRSRCHVWLDAGLDEAYPADWGADICLRLRDGTNLRATRRHAKGDPELRLSPDEMIAKAAGLLKYGGVDQPNAFIEAVLAMADGGPLPALPPLLAPDRPLTGVKTRPYASDRLTA